MSVMIKLKIARKNALLEKVQELPGLSDLQLDQGFGLIPIDAKKNLFVVRTEFVDHLDERKKLSPEILEAYGDIRISNY